MAGSGIERTVSALGMLKSLSRNEELNSLNHVNLILHVFSTFRQANS